MKLPTVKIKGKEYVEVKERLLYLAATYENGYSVDTSYEFFESLKMWVVKCVLTIGENRYTGHAQEIIGDGYINKTSALENAETSAVGRACAMAGIGVIESVASADEIKKAQNRSPLPKTLQAKLVDFEMSPSIESAILKYKEDGYSVTQILGKLSLKYKTDDNVKEQVVKVYEGK